MRKPQVQACLAQVLTQAGLSRDRVLDRTGVLAFAVLAEVATYVPGLGLQLEPDALAHPALAEVEELPTELAADGTPRTRLKLKLRDPTPHLESLRKLFGIDKPDPGGLAERVTLIIERAREAPPA